MRPVLDLHVLVFVEFVGHLARYLNGKARRIEAGDPSAPRSRRCAGFPERFPPDTVGADRTDTRYRTRSMILFLLLPYRLTPV